MDEKAKARQARYRARNAEKIRAAGVEYRERNREVILEKKREAYAENKYQQREYGITHAADAAAKKREKYAADPTQRLAENASWRANNRETIARLRKKQREQNPEVDRRANAKRRALKRGAPGVLSPGIVARLMLLQQGRCVYCRADLLRTKSHLDHVQPLARGGAHSDDNVQLLCPSCNLRKHAKDPVEWAQELGRLL